MNTKILDSIRVEQMINDKGNLASNQFIIKMDGGIAFQSYDSLIVTVDEDNRVITIYPDWYHSVTTRKYRNMFFRNYAHFRDHAHFRSLSTKKGIEEALQKGEINGWKIKMK